MQDGRGVGVSGASRRRSAGACGALMLVLGCTTPSTEMADGRPAGADTSRTTTAKDLHGRDCDSLDLRYEGRESQVLARRDCQRRIAVRVALGPEERRLAGLAWSFPEAHDEQPFIIGGNGFGPQVNLFASPFLAGFTETWQIEEQEPRGLLAAVVYVDAPVGTTLPREYATLSLQPGINCIWLHFSGGWRAAVSQTAEGMTCDQGGTAVPLGVRRHTPPGMRPVDYPAVARFTETPQGRPLIGVRCLAGWCDIGPVATDGISPDFTVRPAFAVGAGREFAIRGWHDEQRLAENVGGVLRPTDIRAALVPAPGQGERPASAYRNRWVRVGILELDRAPAVGTKYEKWGLGSGRNLIELTEVAGKWNLRVTPPGMPPTVWTRLVRSVHYDAMVPGTARFRFNSYDDGIWVPCGVACCYAEGDIM